MTHHNRQTAITLYAVIALIALVSGVVHAQGTITVIANEHEHVFRKSMTFRLAAKDDSPITEIKLFYRVSGETAAHKVELEFDPATEVKVEHVEDMSDPKNYQPPMIIFTYWWTIKDEKGNRIKTDPISFVYTDTRYDWQVLEGKLVRLYWHDQDKQFGEHFFDLATNAAEQLSQKFGVNPKDPVSIVIYNTHDELMSALVEASSEWTGAVTFGRTGCIAIGMGDPDWMERVIPHELTHAMLNQITKPPFGDIPRWLHEGLAMHSEGGMSFEERTALEKAIQDNTLISLRTLNSVFPDERKRAILSYAESYSFVDYIIKEYGTDKLGELIAVFAKGAHYDDAMQEVFGTDMDGMEDRWRAYIGAPPREGASAATPVPAVTNTPGGVAQATPIPTYTRPPLIRATPTPIPTGLTFPCCPCAGSLPIAAVMVLALALVRRRG